MTKLTETHKNNISKAKERMKRLKTHAKLFNHKNEPRAMLLRGPAAVREWLDRKDES
jgi:hypothetical protein